MCLEMTRVGLGLGQVYFFFHNDINIKWSKIELNYINAMSVVLFSYYYGVL